MKSAAYHLYQEAVKHPLPSKSELENLIKDAKEGSAEAIKEISLCIIRLVYKIAAKYAVSGAPYEKLVDAGMEVMGNLPKIIKKYDPEKGKFSTYVYNWIRKYMYEGGLESLVYIGRNMKIKVEKLKKLENENIPKIPKEELEEILEAKKAIDVLSLDKPLLNPLQYRGSDKDFYLADILPDPISEREFEKSEINYTLEKLISVLPPLHRQVIYLMYLVPRTKEEGIPKKSRFRGDVYCRSLTEVGKIMNLSRERIRQIRSEAIKMLKRAAKGYVGSSGKNLQ